jgi:NAD dependent epimerase/dehydratase
MGARVRAFVLYNSFNSWGWLDHVPAEVRASIDVVAGDVRDAGCVRQAMKGCSHVLHLASLIAIPFSYAAPEAYVDTNIKGTLNVLMAARELGVERVVQTSTSEVYGTAHFVPITEEHPLQGQSPYSASKIGADQIALSFQASFGVPVVVVRPFNTYGPRQSARAVIPTIIGQIASGQRSIRLGALHPTRDFSFVRDTSRGLIAGAFSPPEAIGEVINLGSNFEISVGDTVKLIAEVMETEVVVETDQDRMRPENSEVERLWSENLKANRLLGWAPEFPGIGGLRRGLGITAAWFRDPANLRHYKTGIYNI